MDVLDFDFMRALRRPAETLKPDFWLMGEVIHGDYARWVNAETLHSVTNYHLHKALYSAHNEHNYFEIAHTVQRQAELRGRLYNFADNHDVERIFTRLRCKAHYRPLHVLLYTLPGIPSLYYGSEFGVEGRKERGSDASLRPCLDLAALEAGDGPCRELIAALGAIRKRESALVWGEYRELSLTTTAYAFARGDLIVTVNNGGAPALFDLPGEGRYRGALGGELCAAENGRLRLSLPANGGEIWLPEGGGRRYEPVRQRFEEPQREEPAAAPRRALGKAPEQMSVEELQAEILAKLAANGPVTERMRREVSENVYPQSLLNWLRSFR